MVKIKHACRLQLTLRIDIMEQLEASCSAVLDQGAGATCHLSDVFFCQDFPLQSALGEAQSLFVVCSVNYEVSDSWY